MFAKPPFPCIPEFLYADAFGQGYIITDRLLSRGEENDGESGEVFERVCERSRGGP